MQSIFMEDNQRTKLVISLEKTFPSPERNGLYRDMLIQTYHKISAVM